VDYSNEREEFFKFVFKTREEFLLQWNKTRISDMGKEVGFLTCPTNPSPSHPQTCHGKGVYYEYFHPVKTM